MNSFSSTDPTDISAGSAGNKNSSMYKLHVVTIIYIVTTYRVESLLPLSA